MAIHAIRLLFTTLALLFCNGLVEPLPNLNCHPRPEVIPTTHDQSFKYFPYYVQLHRCAGSKEKNPPVVVQCVADKTERVKVGVKNLYTHRAHEVDLVNHTSCKTECVLKKDDCKKSTVYDPEKCICYCDAKAVGPPGLKCRNPNKMWSRQHCDCVCTNSHTCKNKRKEFDPETCKCKCKKIKDCSSKGKIMHPDNCGCMELARTERKHADIESPRGLSFWLSAVVIEFFVMLLIFDAVLYSKKFGFSYNIINNICKKTKEKEEENKAAEISLKETQRLRSSRNSGLLRNRSTRNSSVHPAPSPFLTSPGYDFSNEDVFTN